jgi:cellulose synthase/poly-beta-1,6-N-acetylglucosamine synthase-like glycosyltransferase
MVEFFGESNDASEFSDSPSREAFVTPSPERKIACIVLPAYNEVESLPHLLPLIFRESENIPTHELRVLVVDDDSPDGTRDSIRSAMRLYPRLRLITGKKRPR